ncbi:hypothetical protein Btru_012188 [Bulinus truncatus]|nr:hypothetical protein Btru_012188 [Bulinus truncatus]
MVYKKSEYQNQFKACIIKKHQNVYLENLNLRHQRRDREFMHTPLIWSDSSEEEDVNSCDSNDGSKSPKQQKLTEPEEHFQSLADILTESKLKLEAFKKSKHSDSKTIEIPEMAKVSLEDRLMNLNDKDSEETKFTDTNKDSCNSLKTLEGKENIEEGVPKQTKEKLSKDDDMRFSQFNLRHKPYSKLKHLDSGATKKQLLHLTNGKSRPGNNNKPVRSRKTDVNSQSEIKVPPLTGLSDAEREDHHSQSNLSRPGSKHKPLCKVVSGSRPPFISYGIGDVEDLVSAHRTHNVKALVDVYPTALKAKVRREQDMKKQRERSAVTRSTEQLLDKLSRAGCQDSNSWESEYSKQFHGYEPKDYERALSARAVIPRSTPIPANDNKNCTFI